MRHLQEEVQGFFHKIILGVSVSWGGINIDLNILEL